MDDDSGTAQFVNRAASILIDILLDSDLDLTTKTGPPRKTLSSSSPARLPPSSHSSTVLKLSITRDLWATIRGTVPLEFMAMAGKKLLACLVDNEDALVCEAGSPDDARKQWAMFCAEVLLVCEPEALKLFWGVSQDAEYGDVCRVWSRPAEVRSLVWACFVQKWKEEGDWYWEGAVILLGVPFLCVYFCLILNSRN